MFKGGEIMTDIVIVALISFAGTLLGTLGGIIASAKLTNYRIEQLEKKVDKHNNFAERIPVIEEKLKVENHRIEDLEKYHK
jgi:ABC-type lipoprotein release transport system permease subunit